MRADLARRLAALEARQRPPAPPVDPLKAWFAAMSLDELDRYLADPPPLSGDAAAELADLADRFEHMSDQEIDDFIADQSASPEQETSRGPSRR